MKTIEVSESALESLKSMAQKLQEERDMLFEAVKVILPFTEDLQDEGPQGHGWKSKELTAAIVNAEYAIAACQESTKVMES